MVFEDYMSYSCNLIDLSKYAEQKGIVQKYYGQLKGTYKSFFENATNIQKANWGIRMHRAQKEMLCSSQMLAEAQQSRGCGCIVGYFFLCYYSLFHAMQTNLFLNNKISDDEIIQLSHAKEQLKQLSW